MRLARSLLAVAAIAGFAGSASGHGIWVAERWGELGVVYGHGSHDDAYDPAKISSVKALDATGRETEIAVDARETHVMLRAGDETAVVLVELDNGFYTQGPDGKWVNKPKNAVEGARAAGRYLKHTVALRHLHDGVPALPAQPLQIVPLGDPERLRAGEPLEVKVLAGGKPLPGADIIGDYVNQSEIVVATSDEAGRASVVIRNDGLNVLAVRHKVPLENSPEADAIHHFATLSFEAGHDHDH